jgi:hypothetical protein
MGRAGRFSPKNLPKDNDTLNTLVDHDPLILNLNLDLASLGGNLQALEHFLSKIS